MKRTILIAVLFVFMIFSFWNSAQAGVTTNFMTISQIYTYQNGVVKLHFTTTHLDSDGCGNASWAIIPTTADKNMSATLLSAYVSGMQVSMLLSGCITAYGTTAAKIVRISM